MRVDFNIVIFLIIYVVTILLWTYIYKIKKHKYKYWIIFPFAFYVLSVVKYVFFPIHIYDNEYLNFYWNEFKGYIYYFQLSPGKTIRGSLQGATYYVQSFGNILLLFPLPFLIYSISMNKKINIYKIGLFSCLVSPCIEVIQLFINLATRYPNKVFDIDDLILNCIGVALASIILLIINKINITYKLMKFLFLNNYED